MEQQVQPLDELFTQEEQAELGFSPAVVHKQIENLEQAARYAYGLSATKEEAQKIKDVASAEIGRWQGKIDEVNTWANAQLKKLADKEAYLQAMLTDFHVRQYHEAPNDKERKKLQSIKLPYGITLKSRQPQPEIEIVDKEAYEAYMKAAGFAEPQPDKLKWGEAKKNFFVQEVTNQESGEVRNVVVTEDGESLTFLQATVKGREFSIG